MLTTGSCLFTELTKLKPFNQKKTSDVSQTSDVWKIPKGVSNSSQRLVVASLFRKQLIDSPHFFYVYAL